MQQKVYAFAGTADQIALEIILPELFNCSEVLIHDPDLSPVSPPKQLQPGDGVYFGSLHAIQAQGSVERTIKLRQIFTSRELTDLPADIQRIKIFPGRVDPADIFCRHF